MVAPHHLPDRKRKRTGEELAVLVIPLVRNLAKRLEVVEKEIEAERKKSRTLVLTAVFSISAVAGAVVSILLSAGP